MDQAVVSTEINQALFGRQRYRNIVLICALNHLYPTLLIANTFHRRVPGLHMVISLDSLRFVQYQSEEDKTGEEKEHSRFSIKLTKFPSKEDESHSGYNPARKVEDIEQPITGLFSHHLE